MENLYCLNSFLLNLMKKYYYFLNKYYIRLFYFKERIRNMDKDKRNKNKEGDNYMDKTIIIIGFQFIYVFLEK